MHSYVLILLICMIIVKIIYNNRFEYSTTLSRTHQITVSWDYDEHTPSTIFYKVTFQWKLKNDYFSDWNDIEPIELDNDEVYNINDCTYKRSGNSIITACNQVIFQIFTDSIPNSNNYSFDQLFILDGHAVLKIVINTSYTENFNYFNKHEFKGSPLEELSLTNDIYLHENPEVTVSLSNESGDYLRGETASLLTNKFLQNIDVVWNGDPNAPAYVPYAPPTEPPTEPPEETSRYTVELINNRFQVSNQHYVYGHPATHSGTSFRGDNSYRLLDDSYVRQQKNEGGRLMWSDPFKTTPIMETVEGAILWVKNNIENESIYGSRTTYGTLYIVPKSRGDHGADTDSYKVATKVTETESDYHYTGEYYYKYTLIE